MPKLSLFNDIFREPWMIEPQTAAAQKQVLKGLLMGLEFTQEDEMVQASIGHKQNPSIPRGRSINVVNLEGTMLRDDGPCGMVGTRTLASMLLEAEGKEEVIGHILYIDSGGGAANSVPDLAEAIQACQKPVVAFVDGYMCSAAMYVGSYCRHIIANREDNKVGCIGTMIQLEDWPKQVKQSEGFIRLRIYADGAEEKNEEYEKALEGDFSLIKERILNPHNERFKADIRKNRPSVREDQLKGRTYEAKEAVGTLIDAIGSFDSAVAKVMELSTLNIKPMDDLKNIQTLPTCQDLQSVDGCVTLTKEQMEEIDAAVGVGITEKALNKTNQKTITEQAQTIKDLTAERDELKPKADQLDGKEAEIATLTTERDTLKEENAQKDDRIKELEAILDADPEDRDELLQAMHNGNPAKEESFEEFSDEEAMDYARKVVKGEL
jgi:protease-4